MSLWRKLIHIKIHIALIVAGIVWTTAYATVSIAEEHSADIVNMLLDIAPDRTRRLCGRSQPGENNPEDSGRDTEIMCERES